MEELQDAIEDAQYMNAMHDDVPRPTKAWRKILPEELQAYIDRTQKTNPSALDCDVICTESLGFYFFMKYVKENGSKIQGDFLLDVATFRAHFTENLAITAKKIISDYLRKDSAGNKEIPEKRHCQLRHLAALPAAEVEALRAGWESAIIPDTVADRKNLLGVEGPILDKLLETMGQEALQSPTNRQLLKIVTTSLFDDLDRAVYHFVKNKYFEGFQKSPYWVKYHEFLLQTERPVNEDDFSLFRILGRGGFGMVNGCKRAQTGHLFAMKIMNKKRVKMKKAEALCQNERNIMTTVDSPFVVCMKYSFVTQNDLFLILDLMTGGDLGFHLSRKGTFTIVESRYYAARIILGIKALHEQSIVYRDLKPENILMGEDGRTKLSDLGLACKVGKSGLTGTCGTRGYWAPEMLRKDANGKREKYSLSVDWFSLGCCIFEFIYGVSPFRTERARQWGDFPKNDKADKDMAIDLAIKEMEPEFDSSFDEESKDLILKLLNKDGKARLGSQGAHQIMAHPWFNCIDWANIDYTPPPTVPSKDINMATQSEIGNFADEKMFKKIELTAADHKVFEKWDFISMRSFQDEITEFLIYEDAFGPVKPVDPGNVCCCNVT